jgi:hypothetical protein
MKATDFAGVLSAHACGLNAAGAADISAQLAELAGVCKSAGTSSVAEFAKRVHKQLSNLDAEGCTTSNALVGQLKALGYTLKAAKAKAAANDAEHLSTLVAEVLAYRQGPLAATFDELSAKQPLRSTTRVKPNVDHEVVKVWADRLEKANSDPAEFKSVLSQLKTDKSVTKATLEKITGIFIGVDLRYKSKAAAFKKIEERHYVDTLNESRGRIIDSVAM